MAFGCPPGGKTTRMWGCHRIGSDPCHLHGVRSNLVTLSEISHYPQVAVVYWRVEVSMFLQALVLATLLAPSQKIVQVVEKDAIPAIDDPKFVGAEEGDKFLSDRELVIGLFDGETAKAYSAWILDGHEIVNDRLGDTPVAVTW